MQPHRTLCALVLIAFAISAQAQDTAPNSINPGRKSTFLAPRKAKAVRFKAGNVKHSARYEFYHRVELVAKEKQRILRKLAKKQYSDPRYFGHKHIPKRHAARKMRFCYECGIRH